MIHKIKNFILLGIAGATLLAPGLIPAVASAADNTSIGESLCTGVNSAVPGVQGHGSATTCGTAGTTADTGLGGIASKIVNVFSVIVGIVAVLMIIYGGFRYITSGGDSGNVGNAKNTLIYAIVGLIIVALAQFLVHYVLNTVGSSGLTSQ
ncbi:MAG: pilin [Candidatus Saccharimonadales bacterium]